MKFFSIILLVALFSATSCKKEKNTAEPDSITLEANTTRFYADGFDELQLKVMDGDNRDVSSQAVFYIDGNPVAGNTYTTINAKTCLVKAVLSGKETETIQVTAVPHSVNNFSKKIMVEEYAGAWCGYCPEVTRVVDSFHTANNRIIPVQIHNGDVYAYPYEQQMRSRFGISAFPSVFLNRSYIWAGSAAEIDTELNKRTKCGLAISSTVNGNSISITVKTKFDISTSVPLNLVVMLLEDSLSTPQANYFNNNPGSFFYNMGNPILDYRHHHVLRYAATDIFGDPVPADQQQKNNVYEKSFLINASGYDAGNCKIVGFIQFRENTSTRFGVLNAQIAKAGEIKNFD